MLGASSVSAQGLDGRELQQPPDHEAAMRVKHLLKVRGAGGGGGLGGGGTKPPASLPRAPLPGGKSKSRLHYSDFLWSQATVTLRRTVFYLQHVYTKKQAQEVKDTPQVAGPGFESHPEEADSRL